MKRTRAHGRARSLYLELRALGVGMRPDTDDPNRTLLVTGRTSTPAPELVAERIRANKPGLIGVLTDTRDPNLAAVRGEGEAA